MRYFLMLLLLCGSISAYGQSEKSEEMPEEMVETYCMIVGTQKFLGRKLTIQVDFGQGIRTWKPRQSMLKDDNDKPISFDSMIDALNYMSAQNWSFVDSYALTSSNNQNVYHWIMKKWVPISEIEDED